MAKRLVLASSSPRRKELLSDAGFEVKVVPHSVCEDFADRSNSPSTLTVELALAKARSIWLNGEEGIILAADTVTVARNGDIFGKPESAEEAIRILKKLRNTKHSVVTGVCLLNGSTGEVRCASQQTAVRMRNIPDDEIKEYVRTGAGRGKAGAYAASETGDRFIERIDGSFTNLVGLPMDIVEKLYQELTDGG